MEFDNLNGFLTEKGDKLFDTSNRSLKYGDGVFETMKLVEGQIMFWDDHYERLQRGMAHLKLDDSGKDKAFWENEIKKVIVKNYYKEAKLRLIVFRDAPGLYTPMGNRSGFILEGMSFDRSEYSYNSKGITLGVYKEEKKAVSPLSKHKTTSALIFVLASLYKKENNLDEVVVLNTEERVCEGTASNLFIVKGDQIFTPALSEGCLDGVMRKQIIKYFSQKNDQVEEVELTMDDLLEADEIFLTNSISGVQGVNDFKGRTLKLDTSKALQNYLNYIVSQITPKNLL